MIVESVDNLGSSVYEDDNHDIIEAGNVLSESLDGMNRILSRYGQESDEKTIKLLEDKKKQAIDSLQRWIME